MFIKQAQQQQFRSASFEEWQAAAEQSLKGKSVQFLKKETYEGIALLPLYTKNESVINKEEELPGTGDCKRGMTSVEDFSGWKIAQRKQVADWMGLKNALVAGIEGGEEVLAFDGDALVDISNVSIAELNEVADLTTIPLFIQASHQYLALTDKLMKCDGGTLCGVFANDPVSSFLHEGMMLDYRKVGWEKWQAAIERIDQRHPQLQTVLISTNSYHMGGANAVQQLAIAIAEAVFYIEDMRNIGWSPEKTASKLVFHFAVGNHFFMEICKLRAFRKLWRTIEKAYGMPHIKVTVSAETSKYVQTVLDPHVNMLRSGHAAFAAALGGVDYLHVAPFDHLYEEENDFSMRIARNTQHLLREESYIDQVIDPAGGSYYVEEVTEQLVHEAWNWFQQIDAQGGIVAVLQSGWIQEEINKMGTVQAKDVHAGKRPLIGVNEFAQADEKLPSSTSQVKRVLFEEGTMSAIDPIRFARLAEGFESLRMESQSLIERGVVPSVGLICLGKLKEYKMRADFVTGFLASGDIQSVWSPDCHHYDDVEAFVQEYSGDCFCICGSEPDYDHFAREIADWLKSKKRGCLVLIAGRYDEEQLQQFHIDGALHAGQDRIEQLKRLQTHLGGDLQ